MSAAAQGSMATTKAVVEDKNKNGETDKDKKPAAQLEEDDEFEDFPIEGGSSSILSCKIRRTGTNEARRLDRRGYANSRRDDTFVGGELG
jgi:hypothetical protein